MTIVIKRIVFFEKYIVDVGRFLNSVLNLIKEGYANKVSDQCQKFLNTLGRIIESGLGEKYITRWKLEEKLTLAGEGSKIFLSSKPEDSIVIMAFQQ